MRSFLLVVFAGCGITDFDIDQPVPQQSIAGIGLIVQAAHDTIQAGEVAQGLSSLNRALEHCRGVVRSLRTLTFALEPITLRDHGFTAAADIEQRHRFGDDIASERRIDFLYDDVETADTEVAHDFIHAGGGLSPGKVPGVGVDRDNACRTQGCRIAAHRHGDDPGFDAESGKGPGTVHCPGQVIGNNQYPSRGNHLDLTTGTSGKTENQNVTTKTRRTRRRTERGVALLWVYCSFRTGSLPLDVEKPHGECTRACDEKTHDLLLFVLFVSSWSALAS